MSDFVILWTIACQSPPSSTISWNLLKFMSFDSVMPSNYLILCWPLLLLSVFPRIRIFSNKSALHIRWPEYWNISFSTSPSKEYSGFISFRTDWFDLLAFQGTLKCLLQHHSSKASILWQSAFFMVQLSHPYTTTRKTIALIIWTFVSKVIFLFFNTVYACHSFPSKKEASFNFMAALTFHSDFQKNSVTASTFSPSICHKVMGPDAMSLSLLNVEFQASFFGLLFHSHQEVLQFFFIFYY